MTDRTKDRRKIRSDAFEIAVDLQLSHVAHVLDLRALILADDFGRKIAGVGDPDLGEVLSALGMWIEFNGGEVDDFTLEAIQERDPSFGSEHVVTQAIDLPGSDMKLQLIALGRSIVASIGVSHAAQGIVRIHRGAPN